MNKQCTKCGGTAFFHANHGWYCESCQTYFDEKEFSELPAVSVKPLTKREQFAMAAFQGLLASWGQHDVTDYKEIAEDAVNAADTLIRELNDD